jgi:hypothetical protein
MLIELRNCEAEERSSHVAAGGRGGRAGGGRYRGGDLCRGR